MQRVRLADFAGFNGFNFPNGIPHRNLAELVGAFNQPDITVNRRQQNQPFSVLRYAVFRNVYDFVMKVVVVAQCVDENFKYRMLFRVRKTADVFPSNNVGFYFLNQMGELLKRLHLLLRRFIYVQF